MPRVADAIQDEFERRERDVVGSVSPLCELCDSDHPSTHPVGEAVETGLGEGATLGADEDRRVTDRLGGLDDALSLDTPSADDNVDELLDNLGGELPGVGEL